jgi:tetratricopeptide (TPR) repeat protein
MKRMIKSVLVIACAWIFGFTAKAQDEVNKAIELYNQVATSYQANKFDEAIAKANEAYGLVASTPEGSEEVKNNLVKIIPQIYLSKAKSQLAGKQFADAITSLKETVEVANKFKDAEVAAEAQENIPKAYLAQANQYLSEGNNDGAIASINEMITLDSLNAQAYLLKGAAYSKKDDNVNAVKALEKAIALAGDSNGSVADNAKAQLAKICLDDAIAAQKTKKWNEVIKQSEKSLQYKELPTAYKLIDIANYSLGAEWQVKKNTAKACEHFKKVKYADKYKDPKYQDAAKKAMEALKCN